MAWRSSGTTNEEMVDNLKRFRVISSTEVEAAFRNVDRKLFVPKNSVGVAHKDQPIREGNIHISAPHIYGSVLEALDLKKDSGFSFLNAGSGTCYLTCIAASILGPRSVHYCVEIHEDVIEHSRASVAEWRKTQSSSESISNIHAIHGNALDLMTSQGECRLGFDRIYIGAAIQKHNLFMFQKLLKPGGVLVGPVEDELVKVVRSQCDTPGENPNFTTRVISGVRFAPLLSEPTMYTIIPACVWDPSKHSSYPDSFRGACNQLLLCSNAKRNQPVKICPEDRVNAASMLPRALWVEILSFTHRNWFDVPMNEVDYLRKRLVEEQANVARARKEKLEAEARIRILEKERDVYKVLARTLRLRHHGSVQERGSNSNPHPAEEAAAAMIFGSRDPLSALGLSRLLRRLIDSGNDQIMDDHDDEEEEDDVDFADEDDDDDQNMIDDMDDVEDDHFEENDEDYLSIASSDEDQASPPQGILSISNVQSGPQTRKISVSEEDL